MLEQFISALFQERDIHAALEYCSEEICCYSSLVRHVFEGKDNMLVTLVKLMETIPSETTYKITNRLERELTGDNIVSYVEYEIYKPDGECWSHGRMSAIKTFRENTWKIRYLHSSSYDRSFDGTEQVLEDCFFNQMSGFLGTDISFWYYDIANRRIIHNDHSMEVHGFSNIVENVPESLIASQYVHPDSAVAFKKMYEKLEQGEIRATGDFWIKPEHMDKYWCERIIYTTVYSLEDKPLIAMGISKDVTSEKMWNVRLDAVNTGNTHENHQHKNSLREDMEQQIEKAMQENEFEIFLQPKINTKESKVCGAEALIRWRHPKQGLLQPGTFIPKLEALNLTHLLDYFAFRSVCEYQKERLKRKLPMYPISSNLSLNSLSDAEVIDQMVQLINSLDIPKEHLVIEVTETAFVSDIQIALMHIRRLQVLGIKISMDDFGCGNSSFSQLAHMPVDELKLDMRLVQNAVSSIRGNAVLLSILKLAEWLHIPVVAEGMETLEQVRYLQDVGCFICQGYYYSKPLPISEYEYYEKEIFPKWSTVIKAQ